MKIILSEAQIKQMKSSKDAKWLKEIIDADGSLVSGDEISNEKTIKTNTNLKGDGHPQTSDDFAKETGDKSRMYSGHYGFSITESEDLTEAETEDIVPNQKGSGFMDKNSKIPDITELSKSYQKPDIQSALTELTRKMAQTSIEKELQQDINAIVLKNILTTISVSNLKPQHKKEIQNMLQNGK